MNVSLPGAEFSVLPDDALSVAEISALARLRRLGAPAASQRFTLTVRQRPPLRGAAGGGAAPALRTSGLAVGLDHHDFEAALNFERGCGLLLRDGTAAFPLESTLRTAMCCALPLRGGVALHAAGVVVGGRGVVFFGPSGAGKSTLAASSPHPVLSDELVAVTGTPFELQPTGFLGELDEADGVPAAAPLAALVELAKGPRLELEPLDAATAFRRLLPVVVLPSAPPLWQAATAALHRLVESVPAVRLAWHPAEPPWEDLGKVLRGLHGRTSGRGRLT